MKTKDELQAEVSRLTAEAFPVNGTVNLEKYGELKSAQLDLDKLLKKELSDSVTAELSKQADESKAQKEQGRVNMAHDIYRGF